MKHLAALIRTQWDRAGALGLVIVGLLALLLGWIGMSGAILTYEQLPYILSGGLFGLALIMMGTGLWLSAATLAHSAAGQFWSTAVLMPLFVLWAVLVGRWLSPQKS